MLHRFMVQNSSQLNNYIVTQNLAAKTEIVMNGNNLYFTSADK